ncbi:MAG: ATP-grasp domain-containing protein [Promethearchaeota archaeon]
MQNKIPKKILIVGFNSRPIVFSALKLGLDVIAVDYWGDQDLKSKINNLVVPKEKKLKENLDKAEILVKAAEDSLKKSSGYEGILVGSGFDDRIDLWERLSKISFIYANSPAVIKNARNVLNLFEIAKKKKIAYPITHLASSIKEALKSSKDINYPVVLKPYGGAGGVNIRIASKKDDVESGYLEISQNTKDIRIYIQEFIEGKDVSSMTLSTGKKCKILSINEQIIGLNEVNAPSPFSYCGNIIPLDSPKEINQNIANCSIKLANSLGLIGINGMDFVLKDTTPHLMEINPRFPGTFELVENILETNLLKLHFETFQGKLPSQEFPYKKCGAKYVLFSNGNYKLPDLSNMKGVHDIPFPGTEVNKGTPICTILIYGKNKTEAVKKGLQTINEIYKKL